MMRTKLAALAFVILPLAMTARAQQLTPAEEGRRLYLSNNCYSCHGDVGAGSAYGAPALRFDGVEFGDLSEAIREGEDRGMPPFPALNNSTAINNLYAYFHSMGSSSEPVFYRWWDALPLAGVKPPARLYVLATDKRLRLTVH